MNTKTQKIGGSLWGLSGLLLSLGYILHPTLTVDGMLESIWVPDHVLILISFFTLIFALNFITFQSPDKISLLGWVGYILLSLSFFSGHWNRIL